MNSILSIIFISAGLLPTSVEAKDTVLAKVDGVSIKKSAVENVLWQSNGIAMTESLINRQLFTAAAKKAKIAIPQKKVDARLAAIEKQLPEGETLKKQLKKNRLSYKDLRADIGYQFLRDEFVSKTAELRVSADEIKTAFEANKMRLGKPATFKLRQIVVGTSQEANDVLIAVKAGADFAKLASAKSIDPVSKEKGGELGFVPANVLNADLVNVLNELDPGGISPIVQLGQTFLILKLEEKTEGVAAKFDDVKDGIANALLEKKISLARPTVLQTLRKQAKIERF